MAAYDYRCRSCERVFEVRRAMHEEASAVRCPDGHDDVARLWSAVSVGGLAGSATSGAAAAPTGGGGCCGGGCCG
jgi:putative FmdB family regulatory protein